MYGHSLNGVIDGRYVYCLKLLFIIRNLSAIIVQSWVRLKVVVYLKPWLGRPLTSEQIALSFGNSIIIEVELGR